MKVRTKANAEMQKELSAKIRKLMLALLIIGSIGIVGYIVYSYFVQEEMTGIFFFFPFFVSFVIGLVCTLALNKTQKTQSPTEIEMETEFFENYFMSTAYRNGEKTSESKIYYKDLIQWKTTENYYFLYINKSKVIPVDKKAMGENASFLSDRLNEFRVKRSRL